MSNSVGSGKGKRELHLKRELPFSTLLVLDRKLPEVGQWLTITGNTSMEFISGQDMPSLGKKTPSLASLFKNNYLHQEIRGGA